jgi:hypothetical protein
VTFSRLSLTVCIALPSAAVAQPFAIPQFSMACGGATTPFAAGSYSLVFTIGDPLASSTVSAGTYSLSAGFVATAGGGSLCYPNCDGSAGAPLLTANDFQCFLNRYAAADPYANCDGSSGNPTLTANDFQCFLNAYATGCS